MFAANPEAFDKELIFQLVEQSLSLMLKCATPMLAAAIITGIVVAMFQSVTQVQEQTLSFVPKIVGTFMAVVMYGPEICQDCLSFAIAVLAGANGFPGIGGMGPHK